MSDANLFWLAIFVLWALVIGLSVWYNYIWLPKHPAPRRH